MIYLLCLALISAAAIVGFCAGWCFRGDRDKRRAYRQADVIMRLAAEEAAAFRPESTCINAMAPLDERCIVAVFDYRVLVEVHRDERLTSPGGYS